MAQITVVVPVSQPTKTTNFKGETVGIPFLGEAQRFIMNEDEFEAWISMWLADKTLGKFFYVERHAR